MAEDIWPEGTNAETAGGVPSRRRAAHFAGAPAEAAAPAPAPSQGDAYALALEALEEDASGPQPIADDPAAVNPVVPLAAPVAPISPGDTLPRNPLVDAVPRINTERPIPVRTESVQAVPPAPLTPQQEALGASGPLTPVIIQATASVDAETDSPSPIGVDPSSTGAFHTLTVGEGAVVTTRSTAADAKDAALTNLAGGDHSLRSGGLSAATSHQVATSQSARAQRAGASKANGKVIAAIVAVALVLAGVGVWFILRNQPGKPSAASPAPVVEQQIVEPGNSLLFGGYTYALAQGADGAWAVTRATEAGGAGTAIVPLAAGAQPLSLVLYEGVLYVPENNADGTWDVIAYMLADGSVPTQLTTMDGTVVGGQGALAKAELKQAALVLTDSAGQSYTAELTAE